MGDKVNIVNSVSHSRPHGYVLTAKSFAQTQLTTAKIDCPIDLHFADFVNRSIFERRQLFRKRSLTNLIATGRHLHRQSFMRTLGIVTVTPFIKPTLHPRKVTEGPTRQHFGFQASVKAFVIAMGLWMIRATVTNSDPQAHEPNRQRGVLMLTVAAPRWPIVHQHPLRQPIAPKSSSQMLLDRRGLLIPAGLQTQRIARMIIKHGQRMTALAVTQSKVSFEIHLPELIRLLLFKALVTTRSRLRTNRYPSMSLQDRMHGALGDHQLMVALQTPLDLTSTPARLVTNCQHFVFDRRLGATGRVSRTSRSVSPLQAPALVSLQPLVTGLSADAKTPTQTTEVASRLTCQRQKLLSRTHGRTLLPRHGLLLRRSSCHCLQCYPCPRTPVTYVSGTYMGEGLGMRA